DQPGAGSDIEGAGGQLLDYRGVRLREYEIDVEAGGVEVSQFAADIERPEIGGAGVDRTDMHDVRGLRRRWPIRCRAQNQAEGNRPARANSVPSPIESHDPSPLCGANHSPASRPAATVARRRGRAIC